MVVCPNAASILKAIDHGSVPKHCLNLERWSEINNGAKFSAMRLPACSVIEFVTPLMCDTEFHVKKYVCINFGSLFNEEE